MELPTYFLDFLKEIRLRQDQRDELRSAHHTLRDRLKEDDDLSAIYIADFLQGSYRRATGVRPLADEKADVDIIVVTSLDHTAYTPDQALDQFKDFLDCHYEGKWRKRGRSIQIELSEVSLDLVVTAAPSEAQKSRYSAKAILTDCSLEELQDWRLVRSWVAPEQRSGSDAGYLLEAMKKEEEWRMEPLRIPDREAKEWQLTNPLTQMQWTWAKNKSCKGHYVNVVKAIKWWRRRFEKPEHPKSYPLEHLIGDTCPDDIASVGAGVTLTLETILTNYQSYVDSGTVPYLQDRGVDQDVFLRITAEDFAAFHDLVKDAAAQAREALDAATVAKSAAAWRRLFGDPFPEGPEDSESDDSGSGGKGGYSPRTAGPSVIPGGRFA
jgi:hypothetical protein